MNFDDNPIQKKLDRGDKVDWGYISQYQNLSESFIEKHANEVNWDHISHYQKLSEAFIEKHADKVNWDGISYNQNLSEPFIEKHADEVNWRKISAYQKLSEEFRKRHGLMAQPEIIGYEEYAKQNGLEIRDGYLYAFRDHDKHGRGQFNRTVFYDEAGREYRDWHCDLNPDHQNSYGLGIFPKGNTPVRVKVPEDWGTAVKDDDNRGKARVWAFEIVDDEREGKQSNGNL